MNDLSKRSPVRHRVVAACWAIGGAAFSIYTVWKNPDALIRGDLSTVVALAVSLALTISAIGVSSGKKWARGSMLFLMLPVSVLALDLILLLTFRANFRFTFLGSCVLLLFCIYTAIALRPVNVR